MTVKDLLSYRIKVYTDTLYFNCYYFYCGEDYLLLAKYKNYPTVNLGKYSSQVYVGKYFEPKTFLENNL